MPTGAGPAEGVSGASSCVGLVVACVAAAAEPAAASGGVAGGGLSAGGRGGAAEELAAEDSDPGTVKTELAPRGPPQLGHRVAVSSAEV